LNQWQGHNVIIALCGMIAPYAIHHAQRLSLGLEKMANVKTIAVTKMLLARRLNVKCEIAIPGCHTAINGFLFYP